MLSLTKQDIVKITDGKSVEPLSYDCRGVEFDSREIKGGELFLALKGEKTHGHQFLDQAYERGAALFLVEDTQIFESSKFKDRLILVKDTLKAFSKLAAAWRRHLNTPLIAVTGSVGKTTVKEMLAALLVKTGPGAYSQKSFNNHVGVPYTVCKLSAAHKWGVIEMGMNHPGEIKVLSEIATPDLALITKIAPAHTEGFKDIDMIADAKFEIIAGLRKNGTLILNADDEILLKGLKRHKRPDLVVKYFGRSNTQATLDVAVKQVRTINLQGIEVELQFSDRKLRCNLPVLGMHNSMNVAAAVCAAKNLIPELSDKQIGAALTNFMPPAMRLNLKETLDGRKILDDSYNANPVSMQALLEIARELKQAGMGVGLILGDMLELGNESESYHRQIGSQAVAIKPNFLIAVGELAKTYIETASAAGIDALAVADCKQALQALQARKWEILCVKASRGIGLDKIVKELTGE